jgi:predicted DNA-binding mobile mystery protein A
MSQADLALRLGVSQAAIVKLERAENNGGITLTKLSEVGAQLDCVLMYALVPRRSLEETVQERAHKVATETLAYVSRTMSLEGQDVSPDRRVESIDQLAQQLIARGKVWRADKP